MAGKEKPACLNLVIVKHPAKGDAVNGKEVCDRIRKMVSGVEGNVCLFHDATGMDSANPGYAGEFKDLDKDISARVSEVVCAIPGAVPRMLAHTVAMFSEKDWSIFKALPEALGYVRSKGFGVSEDEISRADAVSLSVSDKK